MTNRIHTYALTTLILTGFLTLTTLTAEAATEWALYSGYQTYLKKQPDQLIQRFFFKSASNKKQVALTFDDGPAVKTPAIIETVLAHQVPATFFLVTEMLNKRNARFYDHKLIDVGLHTHSHQNYNKLTPQQKHNDVHQAIETFKRFDLPVRYFRPAFGIISDDIATLLQASALQGELWSLDSEDWHGYSGEKLISHVLDNLHSGAVILFHDRISPIDVMAIIEGIHQQGYEIVPLSELIEQPSDYPYIH